MTVGTDLAQMKCVTGGGCKWNPAPMRLVAVRDELTFWP